jgi:hypothetical protein
MTDIISRQSPDNWKWVGIRVSSLSCSETIIDEMIAIQKKQIEDNGMELLDLHVFKLEKRILPCVCIELLTRPKQK